MYIGVFFGVFYRNCCSWYIFMIIFDLDGTLADCEHRRHFVDKRKIEILKIGEEFDPKDLWKPDWKSFYESCDKDTPIEPVIEIFRHFKNDIQIWSGRCESVRQKTQDWLFYTGIGAFNVTTLKMRPVGDYTPDEQLKERWIDEAISQHKTIEFVFDDRPKVVRMWRRRGIFVFDVNQIGQEF